VGYRKSNPASFVRQTLAQKDGRGRHHFVLVVLAVKLDLLPEQDQGHAGEGARATRTTNHFSCVQGFFLLSTFRGQECPRHMKRG